MSSYGKLQGDYALDALSLEAQRRGKLMGDPHYSYYQTGCRGHYVEEEDGK